MSSTDLNGEGARTVTRPAGDQQDQVAVVHGDIRVQDPGGGVRVLPELALPPPPASPPRPAPSRPGRWLAALTVIGVAVRVALINAQSLWLDETLSLHQAQLPLVEMWRFQLLGNVHVPLYHTMLHVWIEVFGTSAISLRLFSVVLGSACIPLLYVVVQRLFDTRVALVAAAIGAVAPFWVWHADEARMYPLMLVLGLASVALLFRAVDEGGFRRWAAYAVVTGLGFYSHYFLLAMPPVHLLWVLLQRVDRKRFVAWLASMAFAAAAFAPWLVLLVTRRFTDEGSAFTNHGQEYLTTTNPFAVVYAMLIFVAVFVVGYHSVHVLEIVSAVLVGGWPLVALAFSMRRRSLDARRLRNGAFLAAWLVLLVIGVYLLDLARPGVWYQKYLIMASVPTIALLALGLEKLSRRLPVVLVSVLVVFGAIAVEQNVEPENPVRQDWSGAAAYVGANFGTGDVVAVLPSFNTRALDYYWDDRSPIEGLLRHSNQVDQTIDVDIRRIVDAHAGARLWVISSHSEAFDPQGEVLGHLHSRYTRVSSREFESGVLVETFQLPPRGPVA